jgi:hypothetical protein
MPCSRHLKRQRDLDLVFPVAVIVDVIFQILLPKQLQSKEFIL